MKGAWGKTYLRLIVLLVIVAGVLSGFLLVRNTQLLSSSAITPSSIGDVSVSVSEPENGISRVDLKFRTGKDSDQSEAVSTIAFRLSVKSKIGSNLEVVDLEGRPSGKMSPGDKINEQDSWNILVNIINDTEVGLGADFMAVNTSKEGYGTTEPQVLVSFYVKGLVDKSDLSFDFDNDYSFMYSKRRPVTNIWEN